MTKTPNKTPDTSPSKVPTLSLAVQYGVADEHLPRWRIRRWVQAALEAANTQNAKQVSLTVRLVNKDEGRSLNLAYRHKDYATNVLTFHYDSLAEQTGHIMGDIVICTPILKQEARQQRKPYLHHAAHLVVHGTLHALGYDHLEARQAQAMEALETEVLSRWAIPDPYIEQGAPKRAHAQDAAASVKTLGKKSHAKRPSQ